MDWATAKPRVAAVTFGRDVGSCPDCEGAVIDPLDLVIVGWTPETVHERAAVIWVRCRSCVEEFNTLHERVRIATSPETWAAWNRDAKAEACPREMMVEAESLGRGAVSEQPRSSPSRSSISPPLPCSATKG